MAATCCDSESRELEALSLLLDDEVPEVASKSEFAVEEELLRLELKTLLAADAMAVLILLPLRGRLKRRPLD
jgi:hypothetical protein